MKPAKPTKAAKAAKSLDMSRLPERYMGRPLLWAPKVQPPAKLTGDLSDPAWKSAARAPLVNMITGEPIALETTGFVFCTDNALYVGIRCAEPHPEGALTTGEFWKRDEVEIFIEPLPDTLQRPYHQMMIDTAGNAEFRRWHVYKRWFEEHALEETWEPKVEIATAKGTDWWSVEVRIPFDQLKMSDEALAKKTPWRFNIGRIRPPGPGQADRDGVAGFAAMWSPPGEGGFQWPARFGYLVPETFASQSLIEEIVKAPAPAPDASEARSKNPEVLAEIDRTLDDVMSDDLGVRTKASAQLQAMAGEGPALFRELQAKADAATEKARAERHPGRSRVREVSSYLLGTWRPDDDPPPESVLAKVALFEPRRTMDPDGNVLTYRLLKPPGFDPSDGASGQVPAKKYPLLVWLHGSGEIGSDNQRQLYGGAWEYLRDDVRAKYPCFVLAPQCPPGSGWADTSSNPGEKGVRSLLPVGPKGASYKRLLTPFSQTSNYRLAEKPNAVTRMLLHVIASLWKEFPAIDRQRIYVAGSSMGGFGTYELIARRPDWFAAAMPLCGGGDETQAARFVNVPIWIFHGELDANVKVTASRNMVAALEKAGGHPKYTELPNTPHNLGQPNLNADSLEWLFQQKRESPAAE